MEQDKPDRPMGCTGSCKSCWAGLEGAGGPSGWRMVLASVGLFLGPIVLAIAGVLVAGGTAEGRAAGAVGGLVLGMVISVIVGRLIRRHPPGRTPPECPAPPAGLGGQEKDE